MKALNCQFFLLLILVSVKSTAIDEKFKYLKFINNLIISETKKYFQTKETKDSYDLPLRKTDPFNFEYYKISSGQLDIKDPFYDVKFPEIVLPPLISYSLPKLGEAKIHNWDVSEINESKNLDSVGDGKSTIQFNNDFFVNFDDSGEKAPIKHKLFHLVYIIDQDETLYVHYKGRFIEGYQIISYNAPFNSVMFENMFPELFSKNEIVNPTTEEKNSQTEWDAFLKEIPEMINSFVKKNLQEFLDKIVQSVSSVYKLRKDLKNLKTMLEKNKNVDPDPNSVVSKLTDLNFIISEGSIGNLQKELPKSGGLLNSIGSIIPAPKKDYMTSEYFDETSAINSYVRDTFFSDVFMDDKKEADFAMQIDPTESNKNGIWEGMFGFLKDHYTKNGENGKVSENWFKSGISSYLFFEIKHKDKRFWQFGPLEVVVAFYPVRKIVTLRIKSNFISIENNFNVLTTAYFYHALLMNLHKIQNELYQNLLLLQQKGNSKSANDIFVNLLTDFGFQQELGINLKYPFDKPLTSKIYKNGQIDCWNLKLIDFRICLQNSGKSLNVYGLHRVFRSGNGVGNYKLFGPENQSEENGSSGKSQILIQMPEINAEKSVISDWTIEGLFGGDYKSKPELDFAVSVWDFPVKSVYDLKPFLMILLLEFITMDDAVDFTFGRNPPQVDIKTSINKSAKVTRFGQATHVSKGPSWAMSMETKFADNLSINIKLPLLFFVVPIFIPSVPCIVPCMDIQPIIKNIYGLDLEGIPIYASKTNLKRDVENEKEMIKKLAKELQNSKLVILEIKDDDGTIKFNWIDSVIEVPVERKLQQIALI